MSEQESKKLCPRMLISVVHAENIKKMDAKVDTVFLRINMREMRKQNRIRAESKRVRRLNQAQSVKLQIINPLARSEFGRMQRFF